MAATHDQIKRLKHAFANNAIVLVLGSGVSVPHGIPAWTDLLKDMTQTILGKGPLDWDIITKALGSGPLVLARYLASEARTRADFQEILATCLYKSFSYRPDDPNLRATIELLARCARHRGDRYVLTYNFDDVLERAIKEHAVSFAFQCVTPEERIRDPSALSIVHCHGFIPRGGGVGSYNRIVFDEIQYNEQFNSRISNIEVIQTFCFSQKTCLFVGTSLSDPNTRRLLDAARQDEASPLGHFIIRRRPTPANKVIEKLQEIDVGSLGVEMIWIDGYTEIASTLGAIR